MIDTDAAARTLQGFAGMSFGQWAILAGSCVGCVSVTIAVMKRFLAERTAAVEQWKLQNDMRARGLDEREAKVYDELAGARRSAETFLKHFWHTLGSPDLYFDNLSVGSKALQTIIENLARDFGIEIQTKPMPFSGGEAK